MANLTRMIIPVLAALCMGTVAAEGIGAAYLWSQGKLSQDKINAILAVVHDIDLEELRRETEESHDPNNAAQPAFSEVLRVRAERSLNLDLRETAIDNALSDLRNLQERLKTERRRYEELKDAFDARLAQLEQGAKEQGLLELKRTLEAIHPRQAKDQILKIVEQRSETDERPLDDVVAIFKSMSTDKRKKIVGEFKTEEEAQQLHEILERIRLGQPESDLIQQTRRRLDQFDPSTT